MKPKRVIVAMVMFLMVFVVTLGSEPASAAVQEARPKYPWKIDYIDNTNNIRAASIGFGDWPPQPMAVYYNQDTNGFARATLVGPAQGNCGTNNDWECEYYYYATETYKGKYNDVAVYHVLGQYPYSRTAIVLYDELENALLLFVFSYAEHSGGSSQHKILDFDELSGTMTSSPSVAFDQYGNVHVAVAVVTEFGDDLIYAHTLGNTNGNCDALGGYNTLDCEKIVDSGWVEDPSVVIGAEGFPSIAYYDPSNSSLRYAYPDTLQPNCGPNNDWRCITIEDTGDTGLFPSAAYGGETHYIAYYNRTSGYLRLAKFVGSGGNCAQEPGTLIYRWRCDTIDFIGTGFSQVGLSLTMDGTEPLIAYQDKSGFPTRVRLAQTVERTGILNGNCVPMGIFYRWRCDVIDQGAYDLGREVDLTVNTAGLVNIAYLEDYAPSGKSYLKVARQYVPIFLPAIRK